MTSNKSKQTTCKALWKSSHRCQPRHHSSIQVATAAGLVTRRQLYQCLAGLREDDLARRSQPSRSTNSKSFRTNNDLEGWQSAADQQFVDVTVLAHCSPLAAGRRRMNDFSRRQRLHALSDWLYTAEIEDVISELCIVIGYFSPCIILSDLSWTSVWQLTVHSQTFSSAYKTT